MKNKHECKYYKENNIFIVKKDIPTYSDRDIVMGVYLTEDMALKDKRKFIDDSRLKKTDYKVNLEKYIKIEKFKVENIHLLKTAYLVYFYEEGSRQVYIDIQAILKTHEEAEKYIEKEKKKKNLFWGWYKIEPFEINEVNPIKSLVKELRKERDKDKVSELFESLKYSEYLPVDSKYLKDRNVEKRAKVVELIGMNLQSSDVYILRKLADYEIEFTRKLNYHGCLSEIVEYLYALGNREDVIYAYEVRHGLNNMDASGASYDETLTMRIPKDEMTAYLNQKVEEDSTFLDKYPYIINETKWAYGFEYYDNEEDFIKDFIGEYYDLNRFDRERLRKK